ncbi:MAG TPA: DNA-directed RNA polymerase [Candidatus Hodarchaeales archaeon]|nr:DNA-directed RNA polymerase [Candidatus Hodarchaeales archaeon]
MYYRSEISSTIQIPPNRFGERIQSVVLEIAREKYENSIHPDIGMIVAVLGIRSLMPGKIVPGEGSTFHDVIFTALTFRPNKGELIVGEVAEVIKFGVFIRVGCTDCLCHISQLGNDKFALSERGTRGVLIGKETNRRLQLGDQVRAKIINAQIDHLSMKIAVTLREDGLGALEWLKEVHKPSEDETGEAGADSGQRRLKKKRKKKRNE